ncbi:MAG TPA: hypothetical protein VNZ57_14440 [Longimicrobiales bacterium]|nr:hypothetical protein [Longimicrobiales bacterium]
MNPGAQAGWAAPSKAHRVAGPGVVYLAERDAFGLRRVYEAAWPLSN